MTTASGIGIGIGIGVVIGFGFAFVFLAGNQDTPVLENIPILQVDEEPRFAQLEASYDDYADKTTVVLIFTDNDGKFVKANGNFELTLCPLYLLGEDFDPVDCFTNDFTFVKDSFYTWQDNSGRKRTATQFVTTGELWGKGDWHASADITTDNGLTWEDVNTRFTVWEDE